jgi:diguanylate cyclase (GGDEF)-like protein
MKNEFSGCYLDIPMTASGECIGMFHIEWPMEVETNQEVQVLALSVPEHLSLALSNIKLRESLRHQSIRDPLTGVFNRRYMEETLDTEIPRAYRKNSKVGIMMLDIDHFKRFNDSFGHEAGDLVLLRLSTLLQSKIRGEDIICRFGGEEFVLILPDAKTDTLKQRAEDIRESVMKMKLEYNGVSLGAVTVSIGIAIFPNNGLTGEEVLLSADKALYIAKSEGRNRSEVAN